MRQEAILFDCDGVLVDSEHIYLSVEREMLADIGLIYDLHDYQNRFMGLRSADYLAKLAADYRSLNKGPFPENFAGELERNCRDRLMRDLESVDGVDAFLDAYDGAMAVASSSALDLLHAKLRLTGLHRRFDPHIYSGDLVAEGKPAPDLFLHAAKGLGVEPHDCLVIEDSANGVRAGLAAGMRVWGFAGAGHADDHLPRRLKDAGAEDVFPDFDAMRARLSEVGR